MTKETLYLIYDGECPLCSQVAKVIKLRQAVGNMEIINAREEHALVKEAKKQGYDLNKGIAIKYQGKSYYGKDAMHLLAMLGSEVDIINKINVFLFRSKILSAFFYPLFKFIRHYLLIIMGVIPIEPDHNTPIFKSIFGDTWEILPIVLKKHYAIKPNSNDCVVVEGVLDITVSWLVGLMARLSGVLVSESGKQIPVTVTFRSGIHSDVFRFERVFHYPKKDVRFFSRMKPYRKDEVIEFMRFGICWRCIYHWNGQKVILSHRGYAWRIMNIIIPLPFEWIIGKGHAEETPISDNSFSMWMHAKHPWFGVTFAYTGEFRIKDMSCAALY